ncbi:MAG: LacI family transcriptional regulator, partial [Lentisphaeraceae bacterium]|nr:LacI family transcriptional regulator [Lentisphaeraceae bacterium]
MNATLKSISEAIDISASTVSRVLNGKAKEYRISEKTVKLVKAEAERQNFRPNQIASSLRTKKTNTLGLIIPDISNNYFAAISRAVELEARENGYAIILSDSMGSVEKEIEILALMKSRNVDGLLVVPAGSKSKHLKAENKKTPIVLLDRCLKGSGLPYVSSDNKSGSFEAVSELIN